MEPQFPLRLFSWALSSSLVCPWPGTDSVLAWEACCWQQSYLVVQGSVSLVWCGLQALKDARTFGLNVGARDKPRSVEGANMNFDLISKLFQG